LVTNVRVSSDVELLDFRGLIEEFKYLFKRECGSRVEAGAAYREGRLLDYYKGIEGKT